MEGETNRRSGPLLGSLRWDSGWQGGSWRRKRSRRGRKGTEGTVRDMAVVWSPQDVGARGVSEDEEIRLRTWEGRYWAELRVV